MTLLLTFAVPFLLYITCPSRMWNFDGVACAAALELGNPVFLFHSNHLFYGALGFLFWKSLPAAMFPRALPALQLLTSLLAAGGLVGVYALLHKLLANKGLTWILTFCIGVTAVVWVWSVEAQVYALGFLAISWATYAIFQPESPRKWILVGALHAAAILGHIVHVLWIVPALYWLWKESPKVRVRGLKQYLLVLSLGTLLPYAAVIGGVIIPRASTPGWVSTWLMGSAAINSQRAFQWHFPGWAGPWTWLTVTPRIFWGSFWPYHTPNTVWTWAFTAISALAGGILLVASFRKRDSRTWIFSALWLGVYGVFFSTWEPGTECYRMTDMVPFAVLLALGLKSLQLPVLQWGLAAVCAVSLLWVNVSTRIVPMHQADRNPFYQEALALADATPPNSVYLTVGGTPWLYLLYFTGRTTWNLRSFIRNPTLFTSELKRLYSTRPIFIRSDALEPGVTSSWLTGYTLLPVGESRQWLKLKHS